MQQIAALFDHLVGEDVEIRRDYDAEGFGALAINYEVEFRRLFDWQVAGLGTLNDLVDERRSSTIEFLQAVAVAHERSSFGVFPRAEDGRQPCPEHELGDSLSPGCKQRVREANDCIHSLATKCVKGGLDFLWATCRSWPQADTGLLCRAFDGLEGQGIPGALRIVQNREVGADLALS